LKRCSKKINIKRPRKGETGSKQGDLKGMNLEKNKFEEMGLERRKL